MQILNSGLIKCKSYDYSFCITIGFLNKILTFGTVNKFSFLLLNRIFGLSLQRHRKHRKPKLEYRKHNIT